MMKTFSAMGQQKAARNLRGAVESRSSGFVIRHSSFSSFSRGGYLLLELILALIIFSVAIVGLSRSANIGVREVKTLGRENDIRLGLGSFLEEVRRKPTSEM